MTTLSAPIKEGGSNVLENVVSMEMVLTVKVNKNSNLNFQMILIINSKK